MNIFELAKKYYNNKLWDIDRLKMLVNAEKLTAAEYKEITGEEYQQTT